MLHRSLRWILLLAVGAQAGLLTAAETNAIPSRAASPYETRAEHDPNGIGKFFMGREIAQVMGHQGAGWLERTNREEEEHVQKMVDLLGLQPGENVADIGAGTGYISRLMSKKVGTNGVIYAVEIQQEMLDLLQEKAKAAGVTNIQSVLGDTKNPRLPAHTVDTMLMVDVYHEFDFPAEMMTAMVDSLKPGGRIVFVEYRAEDPDVPIKRVHKMAEAQVKKEAASFGLTWEKTLSDLPRQHMIFFRKKAAGPSK